jgi:16S rRNA (adenine1518-N6/adenine1519-N6)-dimethyltransferase
LARQPLGQHFLSKGSVLDRIAFAACPELEPLVIEIGPGKGALTQKLIPRAARLVAIELDQSLIPRLRERFPSIDVIHSDAREFDFRSRAPSVITGNLPYYAATPIMQRVWREQLAPRAVFLIQKEVAERIVAAPGSRDYGYLSVEAQLLAAVRKLFDVPPSAFQPPPKVDSSVVRIEPGRRADLSDPEDFLKFVGMCFRMKRKTLRNNLAGAFDRDAVAELPEASLRAEQLTIEQFAGIYRRLVG